MVLILYFTADVSLHFQVLSCVFFIHTAHNDIIVYNSGNHEVLIF